jgi:murein DD-endopeptidase MepM/ murein hydrolase activator NlpD
VLRSLLVSSLLLVGCVTARPPKMSFEEAMGTPSQATPPSTNLDASFARFLDVARKTRLAAPVGAPMPKSQERAWAVLLDETEQFIALEPDATWGNEAVRARLQLEGEYQTDARSFGDIPRSVAERVPLTLRALSKRITALTTRKRRVDPRKFRWPVDPLVISSPYGSRVHPIAGEPRFHAGIDLEVPMAQPVLAAEEGTVVFSAWNGAHGRQIELQHDAHWATRYSHLNVLMVRPGTVVKKGQLIGLSGKSGQTTGPHLHFELRRDGDALDPEAFIELPASGGPLITERP